MINEVTGGTPPYELRWDNGVTGDSLTNLPVGNYELTVEDANGCRFRTGFAISVNVASDHIISSEELFALYPNPTTGNTWLTFNSLQREAVTIQLYNSTGQLVSSEVRQHFNKQRLELTDLPSGIYTLQVITGKGTAVERVVLVSRR